MILGFMSIEFFIFTQFSIVPEMSESVSSSFFFLNLKNNGKDTILDINF